MAGWRYLAQRFDGSGNLGEFVDFNLPLRGVEIEETLSGDNSLSAIISPEFATLRGSDGRPLFDEWGVCIWAEAPNGQVYGGILEASGFNGPEWTLDCVDISGVFEETPYDGAFARSDVDPIDMFRYIWWWYQSRPGCNFGVTADNTASPLRIGNELIQYQDFDTGDADPAPLPVPLAPSSYETQDDWVKRASVRLMALHNGWTVGQVKTALDKWLDQGRASLTAEQKKIVDRAKKILGRPPKQPTDDPVPDPIPTITPDPPLTYVVDPYKLNIFNNQNLSSDLDDLSANTPFDWHLTHYWSDESDEADLMHHIRIGYPKLGRRLTELRFAMGENIHEVPTVDRDGADYANEVIVIGNGENTEIIGRAFRPIADKVRRTKVVVDTSLMTVEACNARAELEVAARTVVDEISEVRIIDHPNAPAGAVSLGDEFLLTGKTGWIYLDTWVRCIGRRFSPDDGNEMYLTVVRTDRLG